MRKIFTLLLLQFFVCVSWSQNIFFSTTISAAGITPAKAVPTGLLQNYSATVYFKELNFAPSQKFMMKLDAAKAIEVNQDKWYSYTNGAISYTGKINDDPNSSVVLSKYQNRWHGMITDQHLQKYVLQQTDDETFAISKVEELTFIQQDSKDDYVLPAPLGTTANYNVCDAANPCTVNGVVIDIMVAYTPAAATAYGGVANTVSSITTAVTNMNVANTNSGVNSNISFNLVHTYQVTYTESGATSTDLTRLRTNGDGIMDDVHTQRNLYSADLVSLIVASPTNTCGIGYLNSNPTNYSANNGFNVTVYNCVVSNFSMSHELGHNMGLHHDWHVSSSTTPCEHHHGYVNQAVIPSGLPTTARWRTILAYNDQCSANGFTCSRLNFWSNPNVLRGGSPMGINIGNPNPAFEIYGINRFACVVSAFLGANVLPLDLKNVAANYSNAKLTVNWNTENEINVQYFEIEIASKIPQYFIAKTKVTAKNSTAAFYSEAINYNSTEDFYVRLKCIDKDGRFKYSDIVYVKMKQDGIPGLQTTVISSNLSVTLHNKATANYNIQLLTADGKLLQSQRFTALAGHSVKTITTAGLPAGLYFVKVQYDGETHLLKCYKVGE
jgi:peptidyl-Asp metalloendopeptidase